LITQTPWISNTNKKDTTTMSINFCITTTR
jgi:hypothetical protein